jgi:sodium/potassium-transporting ATPase subunit alpha
MLIVISHVVCYTYEQKTYESMAGKGQRVIACAMLELSESEFPKGHIFTVDTCPSDDLVFLGLIALQDPPKPGMLY